LDFSRAVTGGLFFVPSATFLDNVTAEESPAPTVPGSSGVERLPAGLPTPDGSLRIGSLKGKHEHE
jgi:putative iron-dependent peroxidase